MPEIDKDNSLLADRLVQQNIRLLPNIHSYLGKLAEKSGVSIAQYCANVLIEHVRTENTPTRREALLAELDARYDRERADLLTLFDDVYPTADKQLGTNKNRD